MLTDMDRIQEPAQSSANHPGSRSPNTAGRLLFLRPQLTNSERVHLTTEILDGEVNDDGVSDSRSSRRSSTSNPALVVDNSNDAHHDSNDNEEVEDEDEYNYSDDFESSDSEDVVLEAKAESEEDNESHPASYDSRSSSRTSSTA